MQLSEDKFLQSADSGVAGEGRRIIPGDIIQALAGTSASYITAQKEAAVQ